MTPLNEQAYNYLQKLIMENHFSYQEVYSETKLSKELGISQVQVSRLETKILEKIRSKLAK